MIKSLTDVLSEALIGRKIKLYKVLDTRHNKEGVEYYITEKSILEHPKMCVIIGETFGIINSIETELIQYEGDYYNIRIVDEYNNPLNVNGFSSITSCFEYLD
jgi:hypothetical protein